MFTRVLLPVCCTTGSLQSNGADDLPAERARTFMIVILEFWAP